MTTVVARRSLFAVVAISTLIGLPAGAQEVGHLHHVHMNVTDVSRATEFYQRVFGVVPVRYNGKVPALLLERSFLFMNRMEPGTIGNHQLTGLTHVSWSGVDTPRENDGTLRITDNTHLDHIAFSFRALNAAHRRIRKLGVEIVKPMSLDKDYGFRHFFVRAPNGILVELVEARPWPQAAWER